MKRAVKHSNLRVAGQFVLDALTGRLGLFMMTLAYASFAVVLLAYVSTQVYTNSLMEDISIREVERRRAQERVGLLMRDYAGLVSRARVSAICEDRLGMVQGDGANVTRVRVKRSASWLDSFTPADESGVHMPEVLGSNIVGITEAMRR